MDKWVIVNKSSTLSIKRSSKESAGPSSSRYEPYPTTQFKKTTEEPARKWKAQENHHLSQSSSATITKFLLNTLSDEANPITHSDISARSDYISSCTTGHQIAEERTSQRTYQQVRKQKLKDQIAKDDACEKPLRNTYIYLDGYLEDTTDIELKRLVSLAGGNIMHAPSAATTHIITSQQLSGSKTQKVLSSKTTKRVHVVKPNWIFDSINAGRRMPERQYLIIKDKTTTVLNDFIKSSDPL